MGEHREFVIQTRLGPEKRKQEYYFFSGKKEDQTMIFPKDSGRGVLTADLQAKKFEGEEIHGRGGRGVYRCAPGPRGALGAVGVHTYSAHQKVFICPE